MDTYSTGSWQISLPEDWVAAGPPGTGEHEFASGDGAKGATIGAWRVDGQAGRRSAREVVESFRAVGLAALKAMPGYDWEILVDEVVDLGPLSVVLSDAWARAQSYRIIGVVLARPPLVVRAAFHDYLCEDMDRSRAYFARIVESLQLADAPEG